MRRAVTLDSRSSLSRSASTSEAIGTERVRRFRQCRAAHEIGDERRRRGGEQDAVAMVADGEQQALGASAPGPMQR